MTSSTCPSLLAWRSCGSCETVRERERERERERGERIRERRREKRREKRRETSERQKSPKNSSSVYFRLFDIARV